MKIQPRQSEGSSSIKTYDYEEIKIGTGNFSQYLGKGGGSLHTFGSSLHTFGGSVFRCVLGESSVAARVVDLRCFDENVDDEIDKFDAEIELLHRANHPNIVGFLGKISGPGHIGIVYEFMPKGSLETFIGASPGLDWKRRMDTAVGVADALIYLHSDLKMLHLDVRVRNVLLDHDFTPKLTGFRLAKKMTVDDNGKETKRGVEKVVGTKGCVAPESEEIDGFVSTKTDIYAYGILLLQLVTGKKAFDSERPAERQKLADWFRAVYYYHGEFSSPQQLAAVVDRELGEAFPVKGMRNLLELATVCIADSPLGRDFVIIRDLLRKAANQPPPRS